MGKNLFLIGRHFNSSCEVFDSFSRKFALIEAKLPKYEFNLGSSNKVVSIGNLIFVISEYHRTLYLYDVEKNCWSKFNSGVLKN